MVNWNLKENVFFYLAYLLNFVFALIYIYQKNYEFLIYVVALSLFTFFLQRIDKKYKFLSFAKLSYFVWLLSHFLGGSVRVGEKVLYGLVLIPIVPEPFLILKYDQVIHFFCYFMITLLMYSVLGKITKKRSLDFWIILVLASSSVGALNEIIEFIPVVFLDSNGVGGYYNTLLDIIANLLGSIFSAVILYFKKFK